MSGVQEFHVGTTPTASFPWVSVYAGVYPLSAHIVNIHFNAEMPLGGKLFVSWSPGASATETWTATLDGTPLGTSITRTGSYEGGWFSGWERFIETFDVGPIAAGDHVVTINFTSGDGAVWDWVRLEELREETAWGDGCDGERFVAPGNWATYFTYVYYPMELSGTGDYVAEWQTDSDYYRSGPTSAHLEVPTFSGSPADEARIVIGLPAGTTLGDIKSVSWWEYLVGGYPPHLDVYLDVDSDGWEGYPDDEVLIFEYAYNGLNHYADGAPGYGAMTGSFYQTFSDDGDGPTQVADGVAEAWPGSGPAGPPGSIELHTLAEWQDGITYTTDATKTIDASTPVLWLEIEIDNWLTATECYVDDIVVTLGP